MTVQFDKWRERNWPGAVGNYGPSAAWRIMDYTRIPQVRDRTILLWRPDNRYPGYMFVRRHENSGVELSFDALRHGAKPRKPIIIDPAAVDKLILSLLDVRSGEWGRLEEEAVDGIRDEELDGIWKENAIMKERVQLAYQVLNEHGLVGELDRKIELAGAF